MTKSFHQFRVLTFPSFNHRGNIREIQSAELQMCKEILWVERWKCSVGWMKDIFLTLVQCLQVEISLQLQLLRHKLFFNSHFVPNIISFPNLLQCVDMITASRADRFHSGWAAFSDTLVPGFSSTEHKSCFTVCSFLLHEFDICQSGTKETQVSHQLVVYACFPVWLHKRFLSGGVPLCLICVVPDTLLRLQCLFLNPSVWSNQTRFSNITHLATESACALTPFPHSVQPDWPTVQGLHV